jgi:serine protease AprX
MLFGCTTRVALLAAAGLVLGGATFAGADGPDQGQSDEQVRVVLRTTAAVDATAAVQATGGKVLRRMGALGAVSAQVPASSVADLQQRFDAQVIPKARPVATPVEGVDTDWSQTQALAAAATGADRLAARGLDGSGVDVAVLDTGVAHLAGLPNVIQGPDLSFDSQDPALVQQDGYGHGTAMASLVAGQGTGVAPGARIVSVKVGASDGAVDVTQVMAGIDWVVQHRDDNGLHIRVLNISFGTDSAQPTDVDPLAFAAEVAWRHGIVVVASVGNDGIAAAGIADPASSPSVIAVGAADLRGSSDPADATTASFSSRGDSTRHADVLAPGVHVLSLRDPGSWIDTAFPEARRSDTITRGSGTSQAAAIVSGDVALLLQARPNLTPDQVKALLTRTAVKLPRGRRDAQGFGLINIAAAADAPTPLRTQPVPSLSGTGTVEGARGTTHVSTAGVHLTGEQDIFGAPLDTPTWAGNSWSGNSWSGGTWNGNSWSGNSWSGNSWSGNSWSGNSWSGNSWSGNSWSGNSWSGNSWSGNSWSGNSWSGASWLGHSWS